MRKTMTGLALALGLLGLGAAPPPAALIERQETRADQDLSAQIGMQVAAEEMSAYTGWQVFLGVVTAFGLLGTLAMTARSLDQTRASLALTGASLELTSASLELARETSRAQLRAYLGLAEFKCGEVGAADEWDLRWKVQNYGQTPAVNARSWTWTIIVAGQPDDFDIPEPSLADFEPIIDIAPGGNAGHGGNLSDAPERTRAGLLAGDYSLVKGTVIVFEDCFGQQHTYRQSEIRHGPGMKRNHFNMSFMQRPPFQ